MNLQTILQTCLVLIVCTSAQEDGGRGSPDVTVCESRPCQNGGSCHLSRLSGYRCQCSEGYVGKSCESADPCLDSPCENGGTCVTFTRYGAGWGQYCECPEGFKGNNCEIGEQSDNPCDQNPCQHGGTCHSYKEKGVGWKQYCRCHQGYGGKNCEIADVCTTLNPCKNGGTCHVHRYGGYRCRCPKSYGGRNCTKSNPCNRNPCKHGGTCYSFKTVSEWTAYCRCPGGYLGQYCGIVVDSVCIFQNPCQNGGTCHGTSSGGFRCQCPSTHGGRLCTESNPCATDNPCGSNGRCIPGYHESGDRATFTCICNHGYGGSRCQIANPCDPSPCKNGGRCVPRNNQRGYYCSCRYPYSGDDCSTGSTCVRDNPCKNGGTCHSLGGGRYRCNCPNPFKGPNCLQRDPCLDRPCKNGGYCMSTNSGSAWSYYCRCRENYGGKNCDLVSCPLSVKKCPDFRPSVTDFETCKRQTEAWIKERAACLKRQVQEVIGNKTCSCTKEDVAGITSRGPDHMEVLNKCVAHESSIEVEAPDCAVATRKCAELMFRIYRNPSLTKTCNQTLRLEVERCLEMERTEQLPLAGCGVFSYIVRKGGMTTGIRLLLTCTECNLIDVTKECSGISLSQSPGPVCVNYGSQDAEEALDCFSSVLRKDPQCKKLTNAAIMHLLGSGRESLMKEAEACKTSSEFEEEKDKWECSATGSGSQVYRKRSIHQFFSIP